ncbi:MAG: FUSC family protein [Candidatus Adiutrix sp.]
MTNNDGLNEPQINTKNLANEAAATLTAPKTPIKADKPSAGLSGANIAFALRMTVASGLAWWLAYRFDLDQPHWVLLTVSIVSYPDHGALVAKFIARFIGTCIGVVAVNVMAATALGDPWLFSSYMALWLAFCAYIATCYRDMLTYCFALCGYTSAIIGFPLALHPMPITVFELSYGRLGEISLGLICAWLVCFISTLPEKGKALKLHLEETKKTIFEVLTLALMPKSEPEPVGKKYEQAIEMVVAAKTAASYAKLTLTADGDDSVAGYHYSYRKMEIIAGLPSLEAMKDYLLNNKHQNHDLENYLNDIQSWLENPKNPVRPKAPKNLFNNQQVKHFIGRLNQVIDEADDFGKTPPPPPVETPFRDVTEAAINGVRAWLSVMVGVAIWLTSQWTMGYIFLVLVAVSCTLGATYAKINRLITLTLILAIVAVPMAYLWVFGLLIQVNSIVPAMLVVLPLFFLTFLGKTRSRLAFIFWHCFLIAFIVLVNFSQPFNFDYGRFSNFSAAVVFSLFLVFIFFNVISPSSDAKRIARYKKLIAARFKSNLANFTPNAAQKLKDYAYNAFNTSINSLEAGPTADFKAYIHLHLAAMRAVMASGNQNSPLLETDFFNHLAAENYDECLNQLVALNDEENSHLNGIWWELGCLIKFLRPLDEKLADK